MNLARRSERLIAVVGVSALLLAGVQIAGCSQAMGPNEANDTAASQAAGRDVKFDTFPATFPAPLATISGTFGVEGTCLIFKLGDTMPVRPILPQGSRIEWEGSKPTAIYIRGTRVNLGTTVRVGGGDFSSDSAVPQGCPTRSVMIGKALP